jgi:phosphonate transport system permease protein
MYRWPTPDGRPPTRLLVAVGAGVVSLLVAAPLAEIAPLRFVSSLVHAARFTSQLLIRPDLAYLPELGRKLLETLEMAFAATVIGVALSLPLGLLAARNASPHPWAYRGSRALLAVVRGLPELMWALVFVSAVGLGPLPGVLALALVTVGFLGKLFAEAFETVDPRALEGVSATGAGWLQLRAFAQLPQALPDLVGICLYALDHNLRAAAILGLVGAGGIGYDVVMAVRLFRYDRILLIAGAVYATITALDLLSARIRRRVI